MLSVQGGSDVSLEVDGKPYSGPVPFDFSRGGTVRAYSKGIVHSPILEQRFERIVPVVTTPVFRAEATSYEPGEGEPMNAFDGNAATYWHTAYSNSEARHPHSITAYLEMPSPIVGFEYQARPGNQNGRIGQFELHVSENGINFRRVIADKFSNSEGAQRFMFEQPQQNVTVVRLVAHSEVNGRQWASISELRVLRTR
jgi:hypothetical protein